MLILDEPTAALTDPEIEQLFKNIRRLQSDGVGIIYVSHRMDEIRRIADRITVMRDGRAVMTCNAGEATPAELVRNMTGHDLPERKAAGQRGAGKVALRVRNLRAGERVRDVSFEARDGEILGIAGLVGSGRTETLRAIFGADPKDGGEIFIGDKGVVIKKPADALRAGIGLVPEDRKRDGLLLPQSIRVNTTLNTLSRHTRFGNWLDTDSETKTTGTFRDRLNVACVSTEQAVGELSGGNQQKVVIARWLARDCQILMFDEPTRGIDVAAKDAICQLLRDLAAESKAIVVVSSELVELMALCDRIIVLSQGRITGEFTPDDVDAGENYVGRVRRLSRSENQRRQSMTFKPRKFVEYTAMLGIWIGLVLLFGALEQKFSQRTDVCSSGQSHPCPRGDFGGHDACADHRSD